MRPDLSKVVTEKPRTGGGLKAPKGYHKNFDLSEDAPKGEKIRQKWISNWNDGKQFTDVLGPLNRWLNSKVGHKWDNVYSEISQTLKKTSKQMLHIHEHIFRFVETKIRMIDGVPYHHNWDFPIQSSGHYFQFYVNAAGILVRAPKSKRKIKIYDKSGCVKINDTDFNLKIDGIWYFVEAQPFLPIKTKVYREHIKITINVDRYYAYDPVLKKHFFSAWDARKIYGECVIGVTKRQLNKKEIKKLVAV